MVAGRVGGWWVVVEVEVKVEVVVDVGRGEGGEGGARGELSFAFFSLFFFLMSVFNPADCPL
jgi:hypothetical protein